MHLRSPRLTDSFGATYLFVEVSYITPTTENLNEVSDSYRRGATVGPIINCTAESNQAFKQDFWLSKTKHNYTYTNTTKHISTTHKINDTCEETEEVRLL